MREVQIQSALARYAQASCARGILGSGVAELRTVGLRLGNVSLHSTLTQAGAQHSQSPVKAEEGGDQASYTGNMAESRRKSVIWDTI